MHYNYYLKPLLYIIDDILNDLYQRYYWGYSLPNYLSAVHSVHPNYAIYLDDKKTLAVDDINEIFSMMDESKKFIYDKNYVENLYINYMSKSHKQEKNANVLQENLIGKKVLLIAPGKSLYKEKNKIRDFLFNHDDIITISVNSEYTFGNTDYIFISNIRRFRELNSEKYNKCIITSNINSKECYAQINYIELINEMDYVRDNAGLMLINFLIKNQVEDIILAGFDGYNYNSDSNYVNETMTLVQKKSMINNINNGMIKMIGKYMKMAKITFLTKSYYADILKRRING